jgi:hypothetical protein
VFFLSGLHIMWGLQDQLEITRFTTWVTLW